jgi:hypothetical protein
MTLRRLIAFGVPLLLIAAWVAGARRAQADLEPHLLAAVPGASALVPVGDGAFAAYQGEAHRDDAQPGATGNDAYQGDAQPGVAGSDAHGRDVLLGYVRTGEANGYGGPMQVAVGIDTTGAVTGLSVVHHKESTAFFRKVMGGGLVSQLVGRSASDALSLGTDLDGVTGATRSSVALVESVRKAARDLAATQLHRTVPAEPRLPFRFGWPEIALLLLFAAGFAGSYTRIPGKRPLQWISRILAIVFVGFVYCAPLTLTNINTLLMGYLPHWRDQVYWYLLLLGALLPVLLTRERPYCNYVCPFGSVQECLRVVGGKSRSVPASVQKRLRWFHEILVLVAVVVALYARSPGLTSYEVFGSLFDLTGMTYQFITLAVVMIASLFIARPWCRFLCPIQGVTRYVSTVRTAFGRRT